MSDASTPVRASLAGAGITLGSIAEAVDAAIAAARGDESFSLLGLRLSHLARMRRDPELREAIAGTRLLTAGSDPVARLARLKDRGIERASGAELVVALARSAARHRLPVYLLGGTGACLGRAGAALVACCDGLLDIAGSATAPRAIDPAGPAARSLSDDIVASGARLCILNLGPRAEALFAHRAAARSRGVGFIAAGRVLEVLAGRQPRRALEIGHGVAA